MLTFAKKKLYAYQFNFCANLFKFCLQMTGIKSSAYDLLTQFNIEVLVHIYNIGRNVRSVIFVETSKKSNDIRHY